MNKWLIRVLSAYLIIFVLISIIATMIYRNSYSQAASVVINTLDSSVNRIGDEFIRTLDKAIVNADYLRHNSTLISISSANSQSLKRNVTNLISCKEFMRLSRSLLENEFLFQAIVFPRNEYLLTWDIVSNDYRKEYPDLFKIADKEADDWYAELMSYYRKESYTLLPSQYLSSRLIYLKDAHAVIPFIVPIWDEQKMYVIAEAVYYLSPEWCDYLFTSIAQSVIYQLYFDNDLIYQNDSLLSDTEYLSFNQSYGSHRNIVIKLYIPKELAMDQINNTTYIVKLYFFAFLFGLFLILLLYATRRVRNLKHIIGISNRVNTVNPDAYVSPYIYLKDALTEIARTNVSLEQRLILTETIYVNTLLQNLCVNGIASEDDMKRCDKLLGTDYSMYVVCVYTPLQQFSRTLELAKAQTRFESACRLTTIMTRTDEITYIIALRSENELSKVLATLSKELGEYGLAGISCSYTGCEHLHHAYRQAYKALQSCDSSSRVLCAKETSSVKTAFISPEQLEKLQNAIIHGHADVVNEFFDSLIKPCSSLVGIDKMQVFFTVRQLLIHTGELCESGSINLEMIPDENSESCISRLRSAALSLSALFLTSDVKKKEVNIESILRIIESEFNNPDLSVQYIADTIHYAVKYIYSVVKRATGRTPSDLIDEKRAQFAAELMQSTDKTNAEIAALCGFTSPNTFYRTFKKYYGITPGEYKRQHQ